MLNNDLTFVDLFAGAGGFSEGFIRAGFEPVAVVEKEPDFCLTLKTRLAYHYLKNKDSTLYREYVLGRTSRENLYQSVPEHVKNIVINHEIGPSTFRKNSKRLLQDRHINVLVGGPPCQSYSLVGRSRDPNGMVDDPRNYLYKYYLRFIKRYNPDVFVFENVQGITSASQGKFFSDLKNSLERLGYSFKVHVLNAKDFGILQNRKRIMVVGTHKSSELVLALKNRRNWMVNDLFSDLPPARSNTDGVDEYISPPTKYLRWSDIRHKDDVLFQHLARVHNERDQEIYRRIINMWNERKKRLRYDELPTNLMSHKNRSSFLDRYKLVASDLPVSHTLVAHISKDGHYYIHPDVNQLRSISVREAARIQSFPDNYFFEGSRTSKFKQIGNAVPPLLSWNVAKGIRRFFYKGS